MRAALCGGRHGGSLWLLLLLVSGGATGGAAMAASAASVVVATDDIWGVSECVRVCAYVRCLLHFKSQKSVKISDAKPSPSRERERPMVRRVCTMVTQLHAQAEGVQWKTGSPPKTRCDAHIPHNYQLILPVKTSFRHTFFSQQLSNELLRAVRASLKCCGHSSPPVTK